MNIVITSTEIRGLTVTRGPIMRLPEAPRCKVSESPFGPQQKNNMGGGGGREKKKKSTNNYHTRWA